MNPSRPPTPSLHLDQAMSQLFRYGFALENDRLDGRALDLPGGAFLSIASGGEVPLGLLAQGADEVTALDISPEQLHLVHLKLATVVSLLREDAISFLGYLPAEASQRLSWYRTVRSALDSESLAFWDSQQVFVKRGAIHGARLGRYMRHIGWVIRTFVAAGTRALFECRTLAEQEEVFRRYFETSWLRRAFQVVFHPTLFTAFGTDPQSLTHRERQESFGEYCFGVMRVGMTGTPIRQNHVMQLLLLGRVISPDSVPVFLSEEGFPEVRTRAGGLETIRADITAFLGGETVPGPFDGFDLSNLPDWLSQSEFERVLRGVVRASKKKARLLTRQMHVRRAIPEDLQGTILVDDDLGRELRKDEMLPIWDLIPASVNQGGE